jgi:hypothetical protein
MPILAQNIILITTQHWFSAGKVESMDDVRISP